MSDQIIEPNSVASANNTNTPIPATFAATSGPDMLGEPFWSANPVENGATITLTVPIEYASGKVVAGEYFDNNDPGQGNGTPMEIKEDHLKVTMIVDRPTGSHPLNIRAKDEKGQWSSLEPTVLTVMTTPVISQDNVTPQA